MCRVIVLAVALRVILAAAAFLLTPDPMIFHQVDTQTYLALAKSLLSTGSFQINGVPETLRAPGYPVFLIAGVASGHVEAVTLVLQLVLSCITVLITYKLALLVFEKESIALLAAALCAADPASICFSVYLMSETLFQGCVLAAVYFFFRFLRNKRRRDLIVTAVLTCSAIYVRPVGQILLFLFVALLILKMPWSLPSRVRHAGPVLFLVSVCLLAPWHLRNGLQTGFWGLSSEASLYFFYIAFMSDPGHREWAEGMKYGDLYAECVQIVAGHRRPSPDQELWNARFRQAAWDRICDNPWSVLAQQAKGTVMTFMDSSVLSCYLRLFRVEPRSGQWPFAALDDSPLRDLLFRITNLHFFKAPGYVLWAQIITTLGLFVLNLCALVSIWPGGSYRPRDILLILLVIVFLVAPSGPFGYARFRVPVMPLLNICAAVGMTRVYDRLRRKSVTST